MSPLGGSFKIKRGLQFGVVKVFGMMMSANVMSVNYMYLLVMFSGFSYMRCSVSLNGIVLFCICIIIVNWK